MVSASSSVLFLVAALVVSSHCLPLADIRDIRVTQHTMLMLIIVGMVTTLCHQLHPPTSRPGVAQRKQFHPLEGLSYSGGHQSTLPWEQIL